MRTPQFITLALAHFACCAAHSGPIFHMVSYAMICGIAPLTAVTVYSLAGFSGLGGRLQSVDHTPSNPHCSIIFVTV